jgi:glycerol uptake facilitator-like aquaporin
MSLNRRVASEAIGTALLLACVVGSGVMGERLAGGNVAIALMANTVTTGAVLVALILTFRVVSAHFNPAVTVVEAWLGNTAWRDVPLYIAAEIAGAIVGVVAAHIMFELPIFSISQHPRSGPAQMLSELVATFELVGVMLGVRRNDPRAVPYAVGAYITAAYWFTASTSFANPAVTLARALSDTFTGIRPVDVPGFLVAQISGAAAAAVVFTWVLSPGSPDERAATSAEEPHERTADRQRPVSVHWKRGG